MRDASALQVDSHARLQNLQRRGAIDGFDGAVADVREHVGDEHADGRLVVDARYRLAVPDAHDLHSLLRLDVVGSTTRKMADAVLRPEAASFQLPATRASIFREALGALRKVRASFRCFEYAVIKEAVMKLSAPDFLEMWRDSLALVGQSGPGLTALFEDAACAGIAEDALREAAGGDLEAYFAIQ